MYMYVFNCMIHVPYVLHYRSVSILEIILKTLAMLYVILVMVVCVDLELSKKVMALVFQ